MLSENMKKKTFNVVQQSNTLINNFDKQKQKIKL